MKLLIITWMMVFVLMSSIVLAYGAVREVKGNQVTLTIDPTGGSGIYAIEETLTGTLVVSTPLTGCGSSSGGKVLTCDYESSVKGTIVYTTTGSGTVSGVIVDDKEVAITGDGSIPKAVSVPINLCGNNVRDSGEECDGTSVTGGLCPSGKTGTVKCTSGCKYDYSGCVAPTPTSVCGNNIAEVGEECDGTDVGSETCPTGKMGVVKCRTSCNDFDYTECSVIAPQTTGNTIGAKIDAGLTDSEKKSTSWSAALLSKIANILKFSWFTN